MSTEMRYRMTQCWMKPDKYILLFIQSNTFSLTRVSRGGMGGFTLQQLQQQKRKL